MYHVSVFAKLLCGADHRWRAVGSDFSEAAARPCSAVAEVRLRYCMSLISDYTNPPEQGEALRKHRAGARSSQRAVRPRTAALRRRDQRKRCEWVSQRNGEERVGVKISHDAYLSQNGVRASE